MYLVDTNVLSAGAPTKALPTPELADWMHRHSEQLYLSVITVAEIEEGIAKARRQQAARKAARLSEWLETLLHLYSARIMPLDVTVAKLLGKMSDQARGAGHVPGLADLAIAATAASRNYTILTRNLWHFQLLAVHAHDPFACLPAAST